LLFYCSNIYPKAPPWNGKRLLPVLFAVRRYHRHKNKGIEPNKNRKYENQASSPVFFLLKIIHDKEDGGRDGPKLDGSSRAEYDLNMDRHVEKLCCG
jgi:hypothetical protein